MSRADLPIAWLSDDGIVHDEYRPQSRPPVQLALGNYKFSRGRVSYAVADGQCIICAVVGGRFGGLVLVMAYSLQSGAELWPAAVDGNKVVGIDGPIVWVACYPYKHTCVAYDIATGAAVIALPKEKGCKYAMVSAGPWKGHVLGRSCEHVTLYAPRSADRVWQVSAAGLSLCTEHIMTSSGEWFCLAGSQHPQLFSLRDGHPVASVLDSARFIHFTNLVSIYDPAHVLVAEASVENFKAPSGNRLRPYMMWTNHVAELPNAENYSTYYYGRLLPPRNTAARVIVKRGDSIQIVNPMNALPMRACDADWHWWMPGVDTTWRRPAPGIVAAWHWPAANCAARECDIVTDAIAAVSELRGSAADAAGLVRTVLIGIAKDARLRIV